MKKIIKHFMKPVEIFETLDDDIGMFLIISICTALIFTFFRIDFSYNVFLWIIQD